MAVTAIGEAVPASGGHRRGGHGSEYGIDDGGMHQAHRPARAGVGLEGGQRGAGGKVVPALIPIWRAQHQGPDPC